MKTIYLFALLALIATSCTNDCPETEQIKEPQQKTETLTSVSLPEIGGSLIADSIAYNIVIKATEEDDVYVEEALQNLNRMAFIDAIFDGIYSEKLSAIDYETNETLSIEQVKEMESWEDYSREKIGKIRWIEDWYFDKTKYALVKKVNGIVLGYETKKSDDMVYQILFKTHLN